MNCLWILMFSYNQNLFYISTNSLWIDKKKISLTLIIIIDPFWNSFEFSFWTKSRFKKKKKNSVLLCPQTIIRTRNLIFGLLIDGSTSFPVFTQSLPGFYLVERRGKGRKSSFHSVTKKWSSRMWVE